MKAFKLIRNAAGISMVEVMMAASVMGGLSLTVAQLMKNTSESTKQNEAKQENVNLKGLLQDNLNNTTACTNTFGAVMTPANVTALSGSPTASVTIPNVKDKINAIKYSTSSTNIQPLTITSMSLTNYNSTAFTGDFVVNATFNKSTNNIVMVKPIRIPINFSFSGTTLTACSTMAVGGEWMLGGNAGTVDGTDYVGTSDNVPLNFRVNAQKAGRITTDTRGTTFLGYQAGNAITTGSQNTAIGSRALYSATTGVNNIAIGTDSLKSSVTSGKSIAIGYQALMNYNQTSVWANNIAIGNASMISATTAQSNTSIGTDSLGLLTTGNHNTAIGSGAAYRNTTGTGNTAIGGSSLSYLETGSNNVGLGWAALYGVKTGSNNIGIGQNTLNFISDGSDNIGIGQFALNGNVGPAVVPSGNQNVAVGSRALINNNGGSNNAALGFTAGAYNSSGHYNTFLGYQSGSWAANSYGSRNVFIGAFAGNTVPGVSAASNKLYIETTNNSNPLIEGDFSARRLHLNGKVLIDAAVGTIPASSLVVGNNAGASNTKANIYTTFSTSGTTALNAESTHGSGGSWVYGIRASVSGTPAGSKSIGLLASTAAATASAAGRSFGVWARAGNSSTGYNYSLVGTLEGTNGGTALYAAGDGSEPIDMNAYNGGVAKKWAGIFVGDTYHTGNSSAILHTNRSDVRLKKNIKTLDGSLDKVLRLRGVRYEWKEDKGKLGVQVGLIAQEVEKEFPEVVLGRDNNKKMREVNYSGLVAPLIESVKELYSKILALISSDEKQNIELEKIKVESQKLKAENEKLKADLKNQAAQFDQRMKKIESDMAKMK